MSPHSPADSAPTKEGELVLLDFELWAEGAGPADLIATTRQAAAEAAKVEIPPEMEFGARPHLVGGDEFPSGIESALTGARVGEDFEKEFPPAQAFGERDPKLIELFSMHEISRLPEMRREDAHLDVGTVLNIRGRTGRVVSLTAARVRVDFNPRYAGKTIRGKFKILERVEQPVEKVRALLELTYGKGKEFGVEVHGGTVAIRIPERTKFDLGWFAAKPRVIERVRAQLAPKTIQFIEEYETPAKKEPAAKEKEPAKGTEAAATPAAESAGAGESAAPEAERPKHAHAPKTEHAKSRAD